VLTAAFLVLPPHAFEDKVNLIGYGICHQDPYRSFTIGGKQLPLCARCTGTYLGSMVALVVLMLRKQRRAAGIPSPVVLVAFALGFVFFAVDGLNSYAYAIRQVPSLYTPDNRLRLLSGLACGAGLVTVVAPLFNFSVWPATQDDPILDGKGLVPLAAGLAIAYLCTTTALPWFYYPIALVSVLGIVIVLSALNGLLALVALRRERQASGWRDVSLVFSLGLIMMAAELAALGGFRFFLESHTAAA